MDVVDRIGSGERFTAGQIYGLITGRPAEEPLRLGWAHGALLTTFPGDVTMAKLSEVEALAKGGTAPVQRQSYEPRPADVKTKLRLKVEPTDVRSIRYFAW